MKDFRQALRECGISCTRLADIIGVSRPTLHSMLHNRPDVFQRFLQGDTAEAKQIRAWYGRERLPSGSPILLKRALHECKISQSALAAAIGTQRASVNLILSGKQTKGKARIHEWIESPEAGVIRQWAERKGFDTAALMLPSDTSMGMGPVSGHTYPIVPGNPNEIKPKKEEIQLINLRTKKHFKLFRDPFLNDINDVKDIYLSQDHMFLREMMLEGARHRGFVAVHGEVGCGKSVMRKAVVRQLQADNIKVIFPLILDKSRITSSSLLDAIIMDLTDEVPKRTLEAKSRQAIKLLKARTNNGQQQVLILEEAQLLNLWAFKSLKQIYEFEDGYQKLMGIVLIGQPELAVRLDETQFPQLREVIRRVTAAEVTGLGKDDVINYLKHKFARVNVNVDKIFAEDAYRYLMQRMTGRDGRGNPVSKAYPLTINNLAAQCMNSAAAMGEDQVNADVVINL